MNLSATNNVRRVALYCRVSTEDQAERDTVQAQVDFLHKYADLHELVITGEYIDDGYSGTMTLEERPEGKRLLEDAQAGRFAAVAVYRLDRLGRSLKVLLAAHDRLQEHGVAITSATEPFDTTSPIGTFVFQLLGGLAQLEKETITERMTLGRDRVARNGQYTGGPVPLGYDLGPDKTLIPSARPVPGTGMTEAELVCDLFQRITNGSTARAEAVRLNALGVPRRSRYGGDGKELHPAKDVHWTVRRVADILHNPLYRGEQVLNSRRGEVVRPAPALVSPEVWQGVQERLTRNRALSSKNAKEFYLLRGLIRCGNCGLGYHGETPSGARQYQCNGASIWAKNDPRYCHGRIINADWLEGLVWQDVSAFLRNPGQALEDARQQLLERQSNQGELEAKRKALLAQAVDKETERERVLTLYRRGVITLAEAEGQLGAIAQEAAQLRGLARALESQAALAQAHEAWLTSTEALLAELGRRLEAIEAIEDPQERRRAMRPIVEHLVGEMVVTTDLSAPGVRFKGRPATVAITYRFAPGRANQVDCSTNEHETWG